jgi:hypothetical protein
VIVDAALKAQAQKLWLDWTDEADAEVRAALLARLKDRELDSAAPKVLAGGFLPRSSVCRRARSTWSTLSPHPDPRP